MNVGNVELSLVSDGTIRLDGGSLYGAVPKVIWKTLSPADKHNQVTVGLNCLLVRAGGKNILVDTGMGNKQPGEGTGISVAKAGELVGDLRARGLAVEDIDIVALTHLHVDHAGGCTRRGYGDKAVPTFPRATYLVQRKDWYEATHSSERTQASYMPEGFIPLEESRQLELLDGDTEIAPDVWLKFTGGHTAGHQMLLVDSGDQRVAYPGDILPTPHHLPLGHITAWDIHPLDTLERKRQLLSQAEGEGWLLIFGHGHGLKAGRPITRCGSLNLDPETM